MFKLIKNVITVSVVTLGLVIGVDYMLRSRNLDKKECVFCNEKLMSGSTFYEDDYVSFVLPHKPTNEGHVLIVPKEHAMSMDKLSKESRQHLFDKVDDLNATIQKKYQTDSYLLLQKNGASVGQTEPHVHIHYIPRKKGKRSVMAFYSQMLVSNFKPKVDPLVIQNRVSMLKNP